MVELAPHRDDDEVAAAAPTGFVVVTTRDALPSARVLVGLSTDGTLQACTPDGGGSVVVVALYAFLKIDRGGAL